MPRPGRARRTGALLIALAALGATAACGGSSHRAGAEYAALGDSVSAGAGIAPIVDEGCLRSGRNYPSLVAERMHYSSFEDVTCSGARTTNLVRPQLTSGASNDPQLDAVGPRTRLVTLSIGLNDHQLTYALLGACLAPSGRAPSSCGQVLGASPQVVRATLTAAADRVRDALRLIRRSAPNARIVLVGYPRYLPDSGSCPDRYPILPAMEAPLRSAWQEVDQLWKAAAASAGADYIDTDTLSQGHDLCSADPWVNGTTDLPGRAAALHPFEAFHAAVANQLVQLLQKQ